MRLNYYLPQYDFAEKHSIFINSTAKEVYNAAYNLNPGKSGIVSLLFKIRGIYAILSFRKQNKLPVRLPISDFMNNEFVTLEKVENREIVIGLIGKFWTPSSEKVNCLSAGHFVKFDQPDYCKAAANFLVEENPGGGIILSTETRVSCLGRRARKKFGLYWLVIRPFSGLIRIIMLRIIKDQAEGRQI